MPLFSICIPNYNYEHYIKETIKSVLRQDFSDFEIVVSDNCSTDDSVESVEQFNDPRIRLQVNSWNVGFAPNLDRAAGMARGERMILLSSDDIMGPGALSAYAKLNTSLGERAPDCVWTAPARCIDGDGRLTGDHPPDPKLWHDAVREPELSEIVGAPVLSIAPETLLRRALHLMRNPLVFCSTCYSRKLYERIGGYTGARLYNPDKLFHWKLLSVAEKVYMIDVRLFDYRYHKANQDAQQRRLGALKHLVDEYVYTFETPESVLKRAGVKRDCLNEALVEQDVALRGLLELARGDRAKARRMLHLGLAAYPGIVSRNKKAWALRLLLALGPIGTAVAKAAEPGFRKRWQAELTRTTADAAGV